MSARVLRKDANETGASVSGSQQRTRLQENEVPCHLFRLPAELRTRIYEEVAGQEIHILWKPSSSEEDCLRSGMIPYRDTRYPCPNPSAYNVNGIDQPYKGFAARICRVPRSFQKAWRRTQALLEVNGSVLPYLDQHRDCMEDSRPDELATNQRASGFALLRSCRSMYQEAASIFYADANFVFESPACMNSFLSLVITPRIAAMLQHVRIEMGTVEFKYPFSGLRESGLQKLSGLKKLELTIQKPRRGHPEIFAELPVVPNFSSTLESVHVMLGSQRMDEMATSAWKLRYKAQQLEDLLVAQAHNPAHPAQMVKG